MIIISKTIHLPELSEIVKFETLLIINKGDNYYLHKFLGIRPYRHYLQALTAQKTLTVANLGLLLC